MTGIRPRLTNVAWLVLPLALVGGWASALLLPMLLRGYPITHSTHFNLSWVFQYHAQLSGGQWYPRWLEYSNLGFGNPTFAFYPPLWMVATLPWWLLGMDASAAGIGSMGLALAVLALGLYGYGRCFFPRGLALAVAGLGTALPYVLLDLYWRGAVAEIWGIAVLPWLLWMTQALADVYADRNRLPAFASRRWLAIAAVAIAYGLLILSHLPILLIVTLLWLWMPGAIAPRGWRWPVARDAYTGAILGAWWTAFYLLPVICDRRYVQIDLLNGLEDYFPPNRLMLTGLLSLRPRLTEHWFDLQLLPAWLTVAATVAIGGAVWLWLHWRSRSDANDNTQTPSGDRLQRATGMWIVMGAVSVAMGTDAFAWVYLLVPPLQRIQFSWRWLAIACTVLPMLWGYLGLLALRVWQGGGQSAEKRKRWRSRLLAMGLALAMAGVAISTANQSWQVFARAQYDRPLTNSFLELAAAKSYPQEPSQLPAEPFLYWHWLFRDGLGLADVWEYRAKQVALPLPPDRSVPLLEWADPALEASETAPLDLERWQYGLRSFTATNPTERQQTVLIRTFFYPAWGLRVDDFDVPTQASELGVLQAIVPPGEHRVELRYRGTLAYRVGCWLSLAAGLLGGMAIAVGIVRFRHASASAGKLPPRVGIQ